MVSAYPRAAGLLCLAVLVMGMGRSPFHPNDCGGSPCCWSKATIQEAAQNPAPLTRLEAQSHRGRVTLWDPENRATFSKTTNQTCRVSIIRNAQGNYIAKSDIFPHPVPLVIQMHPNSDFYLGIAGEQDVFIFQQYPGGASFTHTTYDETGEVEYGRCGVKQGYKIKACNANDLDLQ